MAVYEVSKNHSPNKDGLIARRPLVWLNLLCLDAPLIAVNWKWLFAREFGVSVSASATQALFLTAWLIYAADRFADTVSLKSSDPKSLRHQFCLRYRRVWLTGILVIAFVDAGIVLTRLEPAFFRLGLILGPLAMVYLVVNYRFNQVWKIIPIKECLVGFIFAIGTLFVPATRVISLTSTFVSMGLLFAILCSLNCISIAVWERDLDREQGKHSIATCWAGTARFAQYAPLILSITCVIVAVLNAAHRPLVSCLAMSGIFLSALHFVPLARDERTALADLVLLTPGIPFLASLM